MQALTPEDAIVATYREHGHALAAACPPARSWPRCTARPTAAAAAAAARCTSSTSARRFYGGYAIVGGGLPVAVGLALADTLPGRARVTACFFGDGAVAEGEFHESLNLAALWKLPVLFLCENNLYAMGTALDAAPGPARHRAQGPGVRHAGARPWTAWTSSPSRRPPAGPPRPSARGRRPRLPRGPHLPLPRPLDVRPRAVPRPRTRSSSGRRATRSPLFAARLRPRGASTDADLAALEARVAAEIDEAVAVRRGRAVGAGRGSAPRTSTRRRCS